MDRPDGEIFRIHLHDAFQDRCGNQFPGKETEGIGLSAADGETVDQGVVVIDMTDRTGRGGETLVENRNDVVVEVHPEGGGPGELPDDVLLVQSGDAARLEHFLVHGRIHGVVAAQDGFRQQNRDIAVEAGGIPEFGNEVAPFAEDEFPDHVVHVRHGQLDLAVNACLPGLFLEGIVPVPVFLQVVQDGTEFQLFPFTAEYLPVGHHAEVHLIVGPDLHREGYRSVAGDGGAHRGQVLLVGGFDPVKPRRVGIDAGHGSVEENRCIGDTLTGQGVRHLSMDPGGLGGEPDRGQEGQYKRYEPAFRHNLPKIRIIWEIFNSTSCTNDQATTVWPFREGCVRAVRRPHSRCGG